MYKVKPGESMDSIAKSHGISLDEILALNPEVARSKRIVKGKPWYPLHPEDEISVGEESSSVGSAGAEAFLETETKSEPDWSEEEDEYGYTYADKNKPGYMARPTEDEELSKEQSKEVNKRAKGGYEDPAGGDAAPGAMTNWEGEYYEGNYGDPYAKSEEESESITAEPKEKTEGDEDDAPAQTGNSVSTSKLKKWKRDSWAGKDEDGKVVKHNTPSTADFEDDSEWETSSPYGGATVNADNLKDGLYLTVPRNERPKVLLGNDEWTIAENHMGKMPGSATSSLHGSKPKQWVLVNGELKEHPKGKYNYGWDMYGPSEIKSFLDGTITRIDEQDREGKYPTGWGRLIEVRTDKMIQLNGSWYPLYMHYGHAQADSFLNNEVGQRIRPGEDLGTVGKTGKWESKNDMGRHLDIRGYIWVKDENGKTKRVMVSPQEFMPLPEGHASEHNRQGYGGGGPVEGEEPEKKSKNELLRERQRLEAQLRKHGISYKFKKKEKKEKGLTIDELIDMPFKSHGGPVKKYFEGGPSLDQGTGGGQMSDSGLFDEMSSTEVITWREANKTTLSPEDRESVNQLIIKKKKTEENDSVLDDRPRGAADSTPLPGKFQTQSRTTYPGEEPGEWSELEDVKEPDRSNVVVSEGVDVDWSSTDKKAGSEFKGKGATTSWEDPKKSPKDTDISPKKTQKELDLERERDEQKKDLAYMDMQKDLIKSQIKAFNDEQEELVKIDPDRFWKGKGTVSTIVAIIGSAAGAYISGRYGGNNTWDVAINKEIDRDIALQKLDRDDQIKKKAAALKRVEMLVKHYEFMTKDKTAQKNLELIEAKIKTERMKISVKYNKEKLAANDSMLMKNGLTDENLAIMDIRYPKQNIRKRAVKSTKDGKWYVFNDHDAKKKAMVSVVEGEKAISSIGELIDLTKKISFGTAVPGFMHGFDKDLTKVKVLRESLKGALRLEIFGPGVMTDTERALAEKIIGDPTKFFTFDSSQIEMLQTLKRKINYGIRQQLIRGGINIPPSQNDLAVKQYLKSKGWRPTEENKAKTINALIKLEDKHQTGRYWVENETIPL